jgi:diguanylate cyclase (GGDEF)-like protein
MGTRSNLTHRVTSGYASVERFDMPDAGPNLATEYDQIKKALNNITQGLILFDADEKIVVCNDTYIDMFGLSRDIVKPGCTFLALLQHRKDVGSLEGDVKVFHREIVASLRRGKTASHYYSGPDGRTIHAVTKPLAEEGWIVTLEDISEQKQAEAQIVHMAHHDVLTDLPNRTLFKTQLEDALRWRSRDEQVAVLFIDLDNFKNTNDTLGHQIGDELLKVVAQRLSSCLRETDAIARLGGDEFVVIQRSVKSPAEVAQLANRIRDVITAPCTLMEHNIIVDTSIGIAIAPIDGTTPEQMIKNADLALYGAKASGRGTYRFFEQEMDARMAARHALELDLRKAFVNGEFEIEYQPLVNIEKGSISCCEALLRWHHPERGRLSPDTFIPLAEETGLITRIGEWVLRTACKEAAGWADDITLAVNISPVQFRSQNIAGIIVNALAASGLPANRLEIEITEALLLEQTDATLETLRQLHALGVRVAMDDFGTGYSSLAYLQKFPFDKIKIDGSFIKELSAKAESKAIVRAVTSLADSFHMITTAEGVETSEQLKIVKELGCTEMQGYLFSKACSAADLKKVMKSNAIRSFSATD